MLTYHLNMLASLFVSIILHKATVAQFTGRICVSLRPFVARPPLRFDVTFRVLPDRMSWRSLHAVSALIRPIHRVRRGSAGPHRRQVFSRVLSDSHYVPAYQATRLDI